MSGYVTKSYNMNLHHKDFCEPEKASLGNAASLGSPASLGSAGFGHK